jgi:hypothetical protein
LTPNSVTCATIFQMALLNQSANSLSYYAIEGVAWEVMN